MRVLCLHGYGQTSDLLKQKTKRVFLNLTKNLKDLELVYPQGPFEVVVQQKDDSLKSGYAWFYYNPDDVNDFVEFLKMKECKWLGLDQTIPNLTALGNFDVVVGFSQGSHLARYVAPLVNATKIVFISGFLTPIPTNLSIPSKPTESQSQESQEPQKSTIKTLHIVGTADTLITVKESLQLAAEYTDPIVIYHPGGHVIPASSEIRQTLFNFMKS